MYRFPEDTVASSADLVDMNLDGLLAEGKVDGYADIYFCLSNAARSALQQRSYSRAKVLWLVADACSLALQPRKINQPYESIFQSSNARSIRIDEFTQNDLALMEQMLPFVSHSWVKARLADICWLCQNPRNYLIAKTAIDAYASIPFTSETRGYGAGLCWERALVLVQQLRDGAATQRDYFESRLIQYAGDVELSAGFRLAASEMLLTARLASGYESAIGDKLAKIGESHVKEGDFFTGRLHLTDASIWYARANDNQRQADMVCEAAESFALEAKSRETGPHPSYMAASSFYENAIQRYRSVPKAFRKDRKVEERIAELMGLLKAAGIASLGEMCTVSSDTIDISEIVFQVEREVMGKDLRHALFELGSIYGGANKEKVKLGAQEKMRRFPFQSLISAVHVGREGRVVAKRPATGLENESSVEYQEALWAEMVSRYSFDLQLVVSGCILPALRIISAEHRVSYSELRFISARSPMVPPGREALVASALLAGFEGDFPVALHMLVPQLENIIRWRFKLAGISTVVLDTDGTEKEAGFGVLLALPQAESLLSVNLLFELKALFCDPFGANLRNEIAHGLMESVEFHSIQTVYAWWLFFRIVFNTFWQAHARGDELPVSSESRQAR